MAVDVITAVADVIANVMTVTTATAISNAHHLRTNVISKIKITNAHTAHQSRRKMDLLSVTKEKDNSKTHSA